MKFITFVFHQEKSSTIISGSTADMFLKMNEES